VSLPQSFLLPFALCLCEWLPDARADARFCYDLDRGAVSSLRGAIRLTDFRERQAPKIPARPGRDVCIHENDDRVRAEKDSVGFDLVWYSCLEMGSGRYTKSR
jgi:hypothetical protein